MARLIVVSNRVAISRAGKSQRAGGLEVALAPVLKNIDSVWFGWSGEVVAADKLFEDGHVYPMLFTVTLGWMNNMPVVTHMNSQPTLGVSRSPSTIAAGSDIRVKTTSA